ncbi:DUF4240 domain-containing protein [Streptomyces galbus]|uniref:DUF4240 domain-containing protein n=1 Tax=Streptomyces galbus TaxID=33898 RepID=A0A4U5X7G2_STRGB|nr:DUF4240 domain-containing protein [Streptomyces galbus]TKT10860.1 DUF4240 domain-containing protein [Streptomyces galbus]GHD44889.1 hypothetical protein GCM10010335_49870 [Streptomyces galbus]
MVDFWKVIGTSSVRDEGEIDSALERISGQLGAMTPDSLTRFVERLRESLYQIDRRELAEVPVVLANGVKFPQTSDHFLHARCACILAGETAYGDVLSSGIGFDRFVAPFAQEAEGLLYLASEQYEKKTASKMNVDSYCSIESGSNIQGWAA